MISKKSLLWVAFMAMMTVAYGQQDLTEITESDGSALKAKTVWDTISDTVPYQNEEAVFKKFVAEGRMICNVRMIYVLLPPVDLRGVGKIMK